MEHIIAGEKLSAQFSTTGAELLSLKDQNGTEYLWQGNPAFWSGHAPILFPNIGMVRSGSDYPVPKHGVVRRREFTVEDQKPDEITLLFRATPETKFEYPEQFELRVNYRIVGSCLHQDFSVYNAGTANMPFVLGGHPAFNCPLFEGERFEDYVIQFEHPETLDCPRVDMDTGLIDMGSRYSALKNSDTIQLRHSLFDQDAMIFENPRSNKIRLINPSTGKGIEMDFSGFRYIAVWSAVGDSTPFVALEPWMGCATCFDEDDIFANKRGMVHLPPGETFSIGFTAQIL